VTVLQIVPNFLRERDTVLASHGPLGAQPQRPVPPGANADELKPSGFICVQ
jgi:hypothetical protein